MEIKITAQKMLIFLNVLCWIIFIGLCIQVGSYIFSAIFTTFFGSKYAYYFNLSNLFEFDQGHFYVELLLMTIVSAMKAMMFYLIIKILNERKLNLLQPFTKEVGKLIVYLSYLSLGIGLFSNWGMDYSEWLALKGVNMGDIRFLQFGGSDVWLFMGVVLMVIGQIFKRGIEIQEENELTV